MRKAVTLVELLVVIAIIGVLIALLVPAAMRVREYASIAESENNLRQICLGLHSMSDIHGGQLPALTGGNAPYEWGPLVELLPYVEQRQLYEWYVAPGNWAVARFGAMQVPMYVNPLDPSRGFPNTSSLLLDTTPDSLDVSSYSLNAQFFAVSPYLKCITDGLSQTIWLAEHFAWNCNGTTFLYTVGYCTSWDTQAPTFAETVAMGRPIPGDYVPITSGNPPVSTAQGGVTFQLQPSIAQCDPRQPNAASSRGLQVALADGSIRILVPSISPYAFWGMVTPAAGEIVGFDFP